MKNIIKYSFITLVSLFFIVAILIFRPVPIVTEDKAISITGIVSEIYSNKGNDIIFIVENTNQKFYINRGLENNLELEDLKNKLIGQAVTMKYPKYWTPLDWNNSIRHISKLEFRDKVLFNELAD